MSAPTGIKAFVTDLDGTLFNPQHKVGEKTIRTVKAAQSKGIIFIVATGRPFPDIYGTLQKAGLTPHYYITSNGARVHNAQKQKLVEHNLDPSIVREIVSIRGQPSDDGVLDADGSGNGSAAAPVTKRFATNLYREDEFIVDFVMPPTVCPPFDESFPLQPQGEKFYHFTEADLQGVHEAWFLGAPEDMAGIRQYAQAHFGSRLNVASSSTTNVECGPPGVDKGRALTEVAELLGIPLGEIACFGDGMNDVPMLRVAGHPFIMGNAPASVREAVPSGVTIESNADDGVARQLERLFSL